MMCILNSLIMATDIACRCIDGPFKLLYLTVFHPYMVHNQKKIICDPSMYTTYFM